VPRVPTTAITRPDTEDVIVNGKVTKRRPGPSRTAPKVVPAKVVKPKLDPWITDKTKMMTKFEWDLFQSQNGLRTEPGNFVEIVKE